ncbi:cation-translocating P-type ATPase [Arenibacter sp. 6A1]|uniref:cation-translocating P-type ATPase n=1 Tax=Arenibacter sp. 6A1 TaxID=2720391 RepID=UPI001446B5A1|nr:cation-translocating P-type ATPase [Arenibacter sp. 6A1]NKI25768.1 cation-translocating P-type ATPase [Arenibacter sp. 6A1]
MSIDNFEINGLTDDEVRLSRATHGQNRLDYKRENRFLSILKSLAKEPMVILLLVASFIYFISGNLGDAIFLAMAIVLVASISLYQDTRSRNALEKLKQYTQPHCKVIRNGKVIEIRSEELVIDDCLMVAEGSIITADGRILHSNDFSVNEATLTGESLSVYKDADKEDNIVYCGTTVASGLAIARVTAIGNNTRWAAIGQGLQDIQEEKTPLELQIQNFVTKMAGAGTVVFLIVWGLNFFYSQNLLDSLLKALTLAMSILPEEIPVAFTTFMALGAWRLMKMGIVVKQMKTVETLGSATIICTDKTGTITENKMDLARTYDMSTQKVRSLEGPLDAAAEHLIATAMWASEPIPFDPMEKALHNCYSQRIPVDERVHYKMVHEYPLGGKPPMMTHIFENAVGNRIIAAKGAPEAFLEISQLTKEQQQQIIETIRQLGQDGYRILGVGEAQCKEHHYPKNQQDFSFHFIGLVAFYDPPKKNIPSVLEDFHKAGIVVKIVTGDNAVTTTAIAKQVGFRGYEKSMTGDQLMQLNDAELQEKVTGIQVFTRMFPEAKLRIINALKAKNGVVAMIGDGVNDAPALKASHIGIAMGKKGTEIAKEAASLILVNDDLAKMIDAIAMGRKIYTNLKKAIQYVISIHIPIILVVFVPLALGWTYPNIFTPAHVILLELIMGPTCSIIYENEPMEKNTMVQKPRLFTTTFFKWKELITSIVQGLVIALGALWVYQLAIKYQYSEESTRTMVFVVLITANIFLTLVNRSFYFSIWDSLKNKNKLLPIMIGITILITGLLLFVKPFTQFFKFETLTTFQFVCSSMVGFMTTIWYELVKWRTRITTAAVS